jgi:hypothetical protein
VLAEINRKAERFDRAARQEHLLSPETVQKTKAVRHPADIRWAYTQENAANRTYIICKIDNTGPDVNVYGRVQGGGNLNNAVPWIRYHTWLPVVYVRDEQRWEIAYDLQISKDWP